MLQMCDIVRKIATSESLSEPASSSTKIVDNTRKIYMFTFLNHPRLAKA